MDPGEEVAGYRIESVLGHGGMGIVYEATQLSLNRRVALKILTPQFSADETFRERFRREGHIQAAIDHPHIVTVYEAGEVDGVGLFLAMRLVRGGTLKDMIVARELEGARTLRLLGPIADALDTAHEASLIHRDVKPQNILVGAREHAYLADFGLTKRDHESALTRPGQFVGSIDYISPEAIRGEEVDAASDIYSMAAVLFECLAGVVPYPKPSDAAVLYAHLSDPPPLLTDQRPELPPALDEVIAQGMAKDPRDRQGSAVELIREAERAFGKRVRAVITPPGPVEGPEEIGLRNPDSRVRTQESRVRGGPTYVEPVRRRRGWSADGEASPPGRRISRGQWAAALAGGSLMLAALIVGGFAAGRSARGESDSATALPGRASDQSVRLHMPGTWSTTAAPALRGISLTQALAVSPNGDQRSGLVVGRLGRTGAGLLPQDTLKRLGGRAPRAQRVRVGEMQALRYRNLAPAGSSGPSYDVTVAPTSVGTIAFVCHAPQGGLSAVSTDCASTTASAQLVRGKPVALDPSPGYAVALGDLLKGLLREHRSGRARLAGAKTIGAQQSAAKALANAYAAAAQRARSLRTPPRAAGIRNDLADGLTASATGYRRLAGAARGGDTDGFRVARLSVRRGESAVQGALRRLGDAGYKVS